MIEITGYENIGKGKYRTTLIMARHVCCIVQRPCGTLLWREPLSVKWITKS